MAQSWRTRRWDSLRLLTPNWMSRLPGHGYDSEDPDGYRARARSSTCSTPTPRVRCPGAPAHHGRRVAPAASGFPVDTDDGPWRCRAVVVATGTEGERHVPATRPGPARPPPTDHRAGLPRARAGRAGRRAGRRRLRQSGVQIADELQRAGRQVTRRGRRPRPGAADLPRPRHLPLDGRAGHPRRALRRGRGPGQGPHGCRRCNWREHRSGAPWISPACPRQASSSPVVSSEWPAAAPSSRDRWPT